MDAAPEGDHGGRTRRTGRRGPRIPRRRRTPRASPRPRKRRSRPWPSSRCAKIWPRRRAGRRAGASRWPGPTRRPWAPDTRIPLPLHRRLRRGRREAFSAGRRPGTGYIRQLVRDRQAIVLTGEELDGRRSIRARAAPRLPRLPRRFRSRPKGSSSACWWLFFTHMPDADETLVAHGSDSSSRRRRRRTRPALRAKDRRHAPRDRAADQSVRPVEGVRLDDRHRRAVAADRPQGRRFVTAEVGLALDARPATKASRPRGRPPPTRTTTSSRRRRPSGPDRGRHRRRAGTGPAEQDLGEDPVASENPRLPGPPVLAVPLVEDEPSIGALVADEQAGSAPRVLGRGRGAAPGPLAPGRAGAAQRAPARGRKESRGARRAAGRQPRDHGDLDLDKVMQTSSTPRRR